MTTTTMQAERWADEHGFTDGQIWRDDEGVPLQERLEESGAERVHRGQESWAYQWPDGSVLYATAGVWDVAPSLAEASVECGYCGAAIPLADHETVPAGDDDDEWARLAPEHHRGCEWIDTRAHRVDDARGLTLLARLRRLGYRTQVEQAAALGVSQSAVSQIASGGGVHPATERVVELLERVAELEARLDSSA